MQVQIDNCICPLPRWRRMEARRQSGDIAMGENLTKSKP